MFETLRFLLGHPMNQGARASALGRYFSWQLRSRLRSGPFIQPWIEDVRFLVRRGETGLTGNIYCGLHEFAEMAFVLHVARPSDLFIDVGANAGSYTLLAAGVARASVIAVEPVPATHARLVSNVRLNGLESRVECLNAGLSDVAGALEFVQGGPQSRVALSSDARTSVVSVSVRTLDDIVGDRTPTIIKIDVEGYELPVLRGGRSVLRRPALHSVILETNGSGRRYGYDDAQVARVLMEHGFDPYRYEPRERILHALKHPQPDGNTLFVRERARVESLAAKGAPIVWKSFRA